MKAGAQKACAQESGRSRKRAKFAKLKVDLVNG